jgi:hypothetical protein
LILLFIGRFTDNDDDIDRQIAAIQLQEIFRKRQTERREKQNMQSLPQASLSQVFKGHRNARTMVFLLSCVF